MYFDSVEFWKIQIIHHDVRWGKCVHFEFSLHLNIHPLLCEQQIIGIVAREAAKNFL